MMKSMRLIPKQGVDGDLNQHVEYDSSTIDAVICIRTFTKGNVHAQPALSGAMRMNHPGGVVVTTVRTSSCDVSIETTMKNLEVQDHAVELFDTVRQSFPGHFSRLDDAGCDDSDEESETARLLLGSLNHRRFGECLNPECGQAVGGRRPRKKAAS